MSTDTEVFLEHYGVMGMHWGVRKDPVEVQKTKAVRKEVWADRKTKDELDAKFNRGHGKGLMRERTAINSKIKDRIKNDPEYAKAVKRLDTNIETATKTLLAIAVGAFAVNVIIYGIATGQIKPPRLKKAPKPKMPPGSFFNDMTIPGEVVEFGAKLAKKL